MTTMITVIIIIKKNKIRRNMGRGPRVEQTWSQDINSRENEIAKTVGN